MFLLVSVLSHWEQNQAVLEERSGSVSAVFPQPLGISVLINDQLMIISETGSGAGARSCCSCSVPLHKH